jgi:glycosyltransferase involved in cell wall biosynthesis
MDSVLTAEYVERLQIAERAAVEAADEVWTCTPDDRDLVKALYSIAEERIRVLPDVVDVPVDPPKSLPPTHGVFTARLDYYPNIVAARRIFTEIAPLVHPFPLVVAGAQPGDDLTSLPRPDNALLVADPPSIADVIAGGIAVVPLTHGGGSRFKVIEAFAAGVPVVSSLKGAEGLASRPGIHYLRAENPAEFADAIDRLHRDDGLRSRLVRAAWQLAREQYSIEALRNALNANDG